MHVIDSEVVVEEGVLVVLVVVGGSIGVDVPFEVVCRREDLLDALVGFGDMTGNGVLFDEVVEGNGVLELSMGNAVAMGFLVTVRMLVTMTGIITMLWLIDAGWIVMGTAWLNVTKVVGTMVVLEEELDVAAEGGTEEAVKTWESELGLEEEETAVLNVLAERVDAELADIDVATAWLVEDGELDLCNELGTRLGVAKVDVVLPDELAVPDLVTGTTEGDAASCAT